MNISSRTRYGIRLLVDLAENREKPHVSLASTAGRKKISIRYLEQVAVILRRAGFIRSVKGASGGYTLAKLPEEIVIGDALRALEGDMLVVDPPLQGGQETKLRSCLNTVLYERLNKQIAGVIDTKTLASLVNKLDSGETYMYFI